MKNTFRHGSLVLAAQRSHMVTCATRDKNRLRSILLESRPAFEALADLGDRHCVFDSFYF